jgi:hypothetical protein
VLKALPPRVGGAAARGAQADIAANNGHLLAFDNLSSLPTWLSDALCRLASGGSFAVRQLYTDMTRCYFKRAAAPREWDRGGHHPADLADRAIFLDHPVPDSRRQSERDLWQQFELTRPRILGGVLDLVGHELRTLPAISFNRLPRMADFALRAAACETGALVRGDLSRTYQANRGSPVRATDDADANAGFSLGQSARIAQPLAAAAFAATACAEASRWPPYDPRFSRWAGQPLDSLKLDTVIRRFDMKASGHTASQFRSYVAPGPLTGRFKGEELCLLDRREFPPL